MKNIVKALKLTLGNKHTFFILTVVITVYIYSRNEREFATAILLLIYFFITFITIALIFKKPENSYSGCIKWLIIFICIFMLLILIAIILWVNNSSPYENNMLPTSLVLFIIILILQCIKKLYSGEPLADSIGNLQEIFFFIIIAFLPSIFSLDWFFNLVFSLIPVLWFFFKKNLKDIQK